MTGLGNPNFPPLVELAIKVATEKVTLGFNQHRLIISKSQITFYFSVQNSDGKKSQSCLYCFIEINITILTSQKFIFFEESLHLGFRHSGAYQKGSLRGFEG